MSDLYDDDVLLWSERQAALLRAIAAGEPVNERPDWPNITDEVESVGRSDLRAVESLLLQAAAAAGPEGEGRGLADVARCPRLAGGGKAVSVAGTAGVRTLDAAAARCAGIVRRCAARNAGDDGRAGAIAGVRDFSGNIG